MGDNMVGSSSSVSFVYSFDAYNSRFNIQLCLLFEQTHFGCVKMDSYWESIERDFEKHTQSRFTGLPTSSRDENKNMNVLNQLALPTPPPQALHTGISQHSMRQYAIENKETTCTC